MPGFNPKDPIIDGVRRVAGAKTRVGPGITSSNRVGNFISVEIKGVEQFKRNLNAYRQEAIVAVKKANRATGINILSDVRDVLRQPTPYGQFGADQQDLSSRYHLEYMEGGQKVFAQPAGGDTAPAQEFVSAQLSDENAVIVGARSNHGPVVEFGRRAGAKPPPPGALKDWLHRHNIPESAEYPIAQAIAKRGILPNPHLHPSVEKNRQKHKNHLAHFLREAIKEVSHA